MTTKIWPTSTPLKTSIVTKLAGPSTSLALILNWSTVLDVTQPSLMPSYHKRGEEDNQNQILLSPKLFRINAIFCRPTTGAQMIPGEGNMLLEQIQNCINRDKKVVKALKEFGTSRNLWGEEWSEENGLVLYHGKVYIPLNSTLWFDIVRAHHDSPVTGHPGCWRTTELVSHSYWWPGMGRYIAKYVKGYNLCNRTKTFPAAPMGKLLPNQIPSQKWQVISVDLIVELPTSHRCDALLVVVDHLSKWVYVIPTTSNINSVGVAWLFQDHIWRQALILSPNSCVNSTNS